MVAALVGARAIAGSRSSPGRPRCSWPASAWRATGAVSPRPASPFDERLVVSTGFNREGGALGDRHAARRGGAVHGRLRRERPARARRAATGWPSSASTCRARCRSRASTTSRRRRIAAPAPVDRAAAAARDRPARLRASPSACWPGSDRAGGPADGARPARVDGTAAGDARCRAHRRHAARRGRRLMTGRARRPGRARHRQQPRDRRRGRRQGRGRGRHGRRPLPPRRPRPPTGRSPGSGACGGDGRAFAADIADGAEAEALVGAVIERFGRARRPRQQRRTDPGRAVPRDRAGRMGRGHRHRPHRRVPHLPGGPAIDARAGQRRHRQHRLAARPDGRSPRPRPTAPPRPG